MITAYPMSYSKVKTKKSLKEEVAKDPVNPRIDLQINVYLGRPINPEDIRRQLGHRVFVVKGPAPPMMSKWYAIMTHTDGKWIVS